VRRAAHGAPAPATGPPGEVACPRHRLLPRTVLPPAISSLVVISLAWRYLLDQRGPINNLLSSWGFDTIPFLSNQWLILFCAMIITLWQGLPYYMILYLSALANVDKSLYEAAEIDGAGPIRRFVTVTVPGVKVMMFLVATLTTIGCLKIFTEVYLLGGSASPTKTLTMYIRDRIVDPTFGSLGQGDAASVCLFLITFGFIIASQSLQRKAEDS
jgi:putative transmembrane permease msmF